LQAYPPFLSTFRCLPDLSARDRKAVLSRKDLIQVEGQVTKVLGPGLLEVLCDNDVTVTGRLSGRMKKYRVKVVVGDRVQVSLSPYDPSHGLITYRLK
jgi:translation initiation factor IF-1